MDPKLEYCGKFYLPLKTGVPHRVFALPPGSFLPPRLDFIWEKLAWSDSPEPPHLAPDEACWDGTPVC